VIRKRLEDLYGFAPPERTIQELVRKRNIEIKRQNQAQKKRDEALAAMPEKTRMEIRHQEMLEQLKPEEKRLNRAARIKQDRVGFNKMVKGARSQLSKKQVQTFKKPLPVSYEGDEED
jgi:hypothetical protein